MHSLLKRKRKAKVILNDESNKSFFIDKESKGNNEGEQICIFDNVQSE